ncbi:LysR family transcriptional regulator [Streptosporangium sp. NPDC000396]|uniref:LysR family transcriptional regulator n=1 Tax=Streptosporangium sp. NPDC000396 TaxID=3366185 RepID=UPI0036BFFC7F
MVDLEVRELRYFQAVAEELNFTRAARRLGIAQPPLSKAIRQMERRLDASLFERDSHRVTLTPAGLRLLDEARLVLDAVSAAVHRTRRAARSALVITAKPCVATDLLRHIVSAVAALPDAPHVEVAVSGYGEQSGMVRDGRADLALLGSPYDLRGLDSEPLLAEPRMAALPRAHPLAARADLACRDLAGLPMPRWPSANAAERDYWAGRDTFPGGERPTGPTVHDNSQLLEAVALGQAVALVPASFAERYARDDVVYRPVRDASEYTIAIAWREGLRDPWIARVLHTAVTVAAQRATETLGTGLGEPPSRRTPENVTPPLPKGAASR